MSIHFSDEGRKAKVISSGFANYVSLCVWENKVYWRFDDKNEKWNCNGENLNLGDASVMNTGYAQLIRERQFGKLDNLLEERAKKE